MNVKKQAVETYEDIYLTWIDHYENTVQDSTFLKTSRIFKNHILPAMGEYKIDKWLCVINTWINGQGS